MERGPMALFGAIVAVGLGPALWLGAQFGTVAVSPDKPATVIVEQKQDAGGKAGSAPEDPAVEIRTTPRSQIKRLSATPSAQPSASATTESPAAGDDDPATDPTDSTTPTETTPSEPSTPPTEETTEPTAPSTGNDDGDDDPVEEPPAPPESGDDEPATRA